MKIAKRKLKSDQQLVPTGCFENAEDVRLVIRDRDCSLEHLQSDREEADTKMLVHAKDCSRDHLRIVVHSPDTDAIVLGVFPFQYLTCGQL